MTAILADARRATLAGDWATAESLLRLALADLPQDHEARLELGELLERRGEHDAALIQYARALQDAQALGLWMNRDSTPGPLQPRVEHAVVWVRDRRRAAIAALLDPLAAKYGAKALRRIERCLRIYFGEEAAPYLDARQQPTFLYVPEVAPATYFNRAMFRWIDALEEQTDAIRTELQALLPTAASRERVFDSDELEAQNLRGQNAAPSWNGYYFFRHGERRQDNCDACPATAAALDALPLSRIRDHGPEVLFSVFTAGTHLLPHRGVTNARLVAHLPLIVPRDCALRVAGEDHVWREGEVVVFDDTYEHEAWNRSDAIRVVLIFDIWTPLLTDVERAALTDLIPSFGDFRHALEQA